MSLGRKSLLGAAAGLMLLAGTTVSALAADPTPTPGATSPSTVCTPQGGGRWGGVFGMSATVAKILGIEQTELAAERQAGKSLAEIAQTKGVDEATLVQKMVAERKAQLDERVKAGTLPQEQANLMLQRMETQMKAAVERTEAGPMGPGGMRGAQGWGGRGMMRQSQSGTATPSQGFGPRMGGPAASR